jgi:diadenosine tetraphosphate (Ap4A) HIT family hydrolase
MENCFICRKHKGQEGAPPGGYIYEDEHWMVCHAPRKLGPLGTLFIESKRHFLDFAEFNDQEQASYGILAKRISAALKQLTRAVRVYHVSMVEGVPHFHMWLVPRTQDISEHGVAFLTRDDSCKEEDAIALASKLREEMK